MCLLIGRLKFMAKYYAWIHININKICAKISTFMEIMKLDCEKEKCSICLKLSANNWFFPQTLTI